MACAALAFALSLASGGSRAVAGTATYLALGDSVTFGFDPSTPASLIPSFGDQGFVRPFADFLATRNGGVRPDVRNLAIPGELSTSFATATAPVGNVRTPALNLNYPNDATPQLSLMRSSINAIHAAGNSVGFVSLLIGGNDILVLGGTSAFRNASPAEQQAMVASTIGAVQERYLAVLTELKSLAPEAAIFLPGYYNPFPSGLPEKTFYDAVLAAFNPIVAADAAAFGATYVDLQAPFTGRELGLTNIAIGDVHPNQAGYAVIAGTFQQAVAPEPGSLAMLASGGAAGALWAAVRRRSRPSRAPAA